MPFRPERLKALREAKTLSQEQLSKLAGLSQSVIAKSEKGKNLPGSEVLDKLAGALDCTIDYLHGRGYENESPTVAATCMAFDVFVTEPALTDEQREKCRRALRHPDAPKTAQAWRSFAEMIDLVIGPTPSTGSLGLIGEQRPKSKPMAVVRRHRT
jgi:transcriptional regulator with XRE-family HTH domain